VAFAACTTVATLFIFDGPVALAFALLAGVVAGVFFWLSGSKRVPWAWSLALLLFVLVCTAGVTSSPKTVPSMKTGQWSHGGSLPWNRYGVAVTCDESKDGRLPAYLHRGDFFALVGQDNVELTYRSESVLGLWDIGLAVDSINSKTVLSGGSRGFHGGVVDKVSSSLAIVFGVLPLAYLTYEHYKGEAT